MNITSEPIDDFKPFKLIIDFDDKNTARAFYAVINTIAIAEFLNANSLDPNKLREEMNKYNVNGYDWDKFEELGKKLRKDYKD